MTNSPDTQDAEILEQALEHLAQGDVARAEPLLKRVIANAPPQHELIEELPDGTLNIKFWGVENFIHYCMWQQEQGQTRNITWVPSIYPRAFFHMGFLCVKMQRYQEALEWLERGHHLEPTNPHFALEKAQAFVRLGDHAQAIALFDSVAEIGQFVSKHELAVARRGRGFVLIEMGKLDDAEQAFRESLELEPENHIALNELEYIRRLRLGEPPAHCETVATHDESFSRCAACGREFTEGVLVPFEGGVVPICNRCKNKMTKKWWQFWK